MRIIRIILLNLYLVALSAHSYEDMAYAKPLPHGGYLKDMHTALSEAAAGYGWQVVQQAGGQFQATLSHKGYDLEIALQVDHQTITIELLQANSAGCNKPCIQADDAVQGWLLRLRRALGNKITLAARDQALLDMALEQQQRL